MSECSVGLVVSISFCASGPDRGKTTLELRDIYWLMKEEIFDSSLLAKGDTDKLEETLKSWLGSDTNLTQQSYPKYVCLKL